MSLFKRSKRSARARHGVHDVFTPTRPARLNYVQRPALDSQLADALRTPGKQLIVYGESGSGKSTLLRNKLAQFNTRYITTQCSAAMSYEQLLLDAFDQLNPYYIHEKSAQRNRSISPGVAADFKAIKLSLDASTGRSAGEVQERILPPQLTPQSLATFLGELEMCWVIEDFHKIRDDQKTLYAQCLKIFSDMSDKYVKTKTITIGATETARQVVQYEPEMRRRVSELLVPLMQPGELRSIIVKGQELLNVNLNHVIGAIVSYSAGMPSVCHQIALNVCLARGIDETQPKLIRVTVRDLKPAMDRYVEELSDTIKFAFDRAGTPHSRRKLADSRPILAILASGPVSGMSIDEILSRMASKAPRVPKASLRAYLKELTEENYGSIVRFGTDGKYRFSEPIYHTFAKATLTEAPAEDATVPGQIGRVRPGSGSRPLLASGSSAVLLEALTAKSLFDTMHDREPQAFGIRSWSIISNTDLDHWMKTLEARTDQETLGVGNSSPARSGVLDAADQSSVGGDET
jgi:hypothetical protein